MDEAHTPAMVLNSAVRDRQKDKKANEQKVQKVVNSVIFAFFCYITFTIIALWWHRTNGGHEEQKRMMNCFVEEFIFCQFEQTQSTKAIELELEQPKNRGLRGLVG